MKRISAGIVSSQEILSGVHLIWLDAPEIAPIAMPGQFVMAGCGEDCLLRRPLSIHQVEGGRLAFLFSVTGKGTNWLAQQKPGDELDLLGPLGNGFSVSPKSRSLLLVAGGIGIAPLYFLARQAIHRGYIVKLMVGASTASYLYPRHLLFPEINVDITTEDGSAGRKGMVTDSLPTCIDRADQVFACGPMPMYVDMYRRRELFKGKPVQVSLEVRMGCGLGICYGCTVKTRNGLRSVCQDGPVFELDDVLWDEL